MYHQVFKRNSFRLFINQIFFFLRVPTAGIEVLVNGKYHCLVRQTDNFFVGTGLGKFSTPLKVRLTAINGKQVETTIAEIKNDVSFPTSVQYKGMKCASKYADRYASWIKLFNNNNNNKLYFIIIIIIIIIMTH